jgi:hypothetical protein
MTCTQCGADLEMTFWGPVGTSNLGWSCMVDGGLHLALTTPAESW